MPLTVKIVCLLIICWYIFGVIAYSIAFFKKYHEMKVKFEINDIVTIILWPFIDIKGIL